MKITQVLTTQKKITHSFVTLAYYKWREFKAKFYLWEDPNNIKVLDPKTLYCGSLLPHQRSHKGHLKKKQKNKKKKNEATKVYEAILLSRNVILNNNNNNNNNPLLKASFGWSGHGEGEKWGRKNLYLRFFLSIIHHTLPFLIFNISHLLLGMIFLFSLTWVIASFSFSFFLFLVGCLHGHRHGHEHEYKCRYDTTTQAIFE